MVKIWDAHRGTVLQTLQGHVNAQVMSVDWSPDGRRIASAGASVDSTVRIWNAKSGELIRTINFEPYTWVYRVAWSRDSRHVASGTSEVRIWQAETGKLVETFSETRRDVRSLRWAPDSRRVTSSAGGGTVLISDAETGRATRLAGHTGSVTSVDWSPDGTRLVSGSGESRSIKIWNTQTGELVLDLNVTGTAPFSVRWSPDGSRIVYGEQMSRDGEIYGIIQILDAATGDLVSTLPTQLGGAGLIRWSPDGTKLAHGGTMRIDGRVRSLVEIRDAQSGRVLNTLVQRENSPGVMFLAWSPDGTRIASGSWDGSIRVWGRRPEPKASSDERELSIERLRFKNPDGPVYAHGEVEFRHRVSRPPMGIPLFRR